MDAILEEVRSGLVRPQKELPSALFYDETGSELFEEITRLPEYYLTRAEQALLREHAAGWVGELNPCSLVELGAGSAEKTRVILDAMLAQGVGGLYVPVDIDAIYLARTADALHGEYPRLTIAPLAADFASALARLPRRTGDTLFVFLGSTIGNFPPNAAVDLLRRVAEAMRADDRFLLGVDLRKDPAVIEAAYNDASGVTAAFNLNILRVINRRFRADFKIDGFRHRAFYNPTDHCVEMHLVSTRAQSVHIPAVGDLEIAAGETIRTEISCKYDRPGVEQMLTSAGLTLERWVADRDELFGLALSAPAGGPRRGKAR